VNTPSISETEMTILRVLWDEGAGTVREVDAKLRKQGRRWAYTTVLTLLQRLEAKGCVERDKVRVPHVFRPAVSREDLLERRLKALADELAGGTATPLVQALVTGNRFSGEEIEQLRRLLDQAEQRNRRRRPRRRKRGPE
jgi:predicted transcriptional regulator